MGVLSAVTLDRLFKVDVEVVGVTFDLLTGAAETDDVGVGNDTVEVVEKLNEVSVLDVVKPDPPNMEDSFGFSFSNL